MPQELAAKPLSTDTELLLEPSGGRALLVERSQMPFKRSPAPAPQQPEIIQVFPGAEEAEEAEVAEVAEVAEEATPAKEIKVETKRAAILLDKIMYAVQKALDENKIPGKAGVAATPGDLAAFTGPGLERRGNTHNRVYWRCYFNAVSCF